MVAALTFLTVPWKTNLALPASCSVGGGGGMRFSFGAWDRGCTDTSRFRARPTGPANESSLAGKAASGGQYTTAACRKHAATARPARIREPSSRESGEG